MGRLRERENAEDEERASRQHIIIEGTNKGRRMCAGLAFVKVATDFYEARFVSYLQKNTIYYVDVMSVHLNSSYEVCMYRLLAVWVSWNM